MNARLMSLLLGGAAAATLSVGLAAPASADPNNGTSTVTACVVDYGAGYTMSVVADVTKANGVTTAVSNAHVDAVSILPLTQFSGQQASVTGNHVDGSALLTEIIPTPWGNVNGPSRLLSCSADL